MNQPLPQISLFEMDIFHRLHILLCVFSSLCFYLWFNHEISFQWLRWTWFCFCVCPCGVFFRAQEHHMKEELWWGERTWQQSGNQSSFCLFWTFDEIVWSSVSKSSSVLVRASVLTADNDGNVSLSFVGSLLVLTHCGSVLKNSLVLYKQTKLLYTSTDINCT